jgi:hypothetical protein
MDALITALLDSGNVNSILAAIFLYLYLAEKKAHTGTQAERISDLKVSTDSLHKSVAVLEAVRSDYNRGSTQ